MKIVKIKDKQVHKFIFLTKILAVVIALLFLSQIPLEVFADEPIVIVLDPGHGGENLGAEYEKYTEKDMTLVLANAMKEELEKYSNIKVYLTRDTDKDMSIKDRAAFAASVNADFLFCLHFNMSVKHDLFGAEVWIPSRGSLYTKGYSFAETEMQALTELGLYSRGIKTKLNNRGENYYGILRYCSDNQIPSALIEHCHLDQPKDQPFYQSGEEQLIAFGKLDATAVAKYFHLHSDELGVDYSDYEVVECKTPDGVVKPDESAPELCRITVTNINPDTGEVTLKMEAHDNDSYILYCNYSIDGGNTYSDLMEWPRPNVWNESLDENTFTIQIPFDQSVEIRTTAYNSFDAWTESNIVLVDPIENPVTKAQREHEELLAQYEEIIYDEKDINPVEEDNLNYLFSAVLLLVLIIIPLILIILFWIKKISKGKRKP